MHSMRISVDIDEATLTEVMALTGENQKSRALAKAIMEFTYRRRAKELPFRLGYSSIRRSSLLRMCRFD